MEKIIEHIINKNKMKIERNEHALEEGMSSHAVKDLNLCNEMREEFIEDLEQIKSLLPKPVAVPDFVAEWIEHVKRLHWGIIDLFSPEASNHSIAPLVEEWLTKENAELIARAWLEDYTVEKEQLYYVAFCYDRFLVKSNAKFSDGTDFIWIETLEEIEQQGIELKHHFTEKQIKAIDERYWAFAVPVEEEAR